MPEATTAHPRPLRLLVTLFVVYLVCLTWLILWKFELPWVGAAALLPRPLKLVPFVASGDADASAPLELLANVLFFAPFGLYLGLLAPRWRWWRIGLVVAGSSLVLETVQHLISVGTFDTTDIITNTAGGLLGFGVLVLARRRLGERTAAVATRVCLIAAGVLLVAIAAFIASPLHYSQPRDVVVPLPGSSRVP